MVLLEIGGVNVWDLTAVPSFEILLEDDMEQAAVKIQSFLRCHTAFLLYKEKRRAIVQLQRCWRLKRSLASFSRSHHPHSSTEGKQESNYGKRIGQEDNGFLVLTNARYNLPETPRLNKSPLPSCSYFPIYRHNKLIYSNGGNLTPTKYHTFQKISEFLWRAPKVEAISYPVAIVPGGDPHTHTHGSDPTNALSSPDTNMDCAEFLYPVSPDWNTTKNKRSRALPLLLLPECGDKGPILTMPKILRIHQNVMNALTIVGLILCTILTFRWTSKHFTSTYMCAPVRHGSQIDEAHTYIAPWWAPTFSKDLMFEALCHRMMPRYELRLHRSQFKIHDEHHNCSLDGVGSAIVLGGQIYFRMENGAIYSKSLPWLTNEEGLRRSTMFGEDFDQNNVDRRNAC